MNAPKPVTLSHLAVGALFRFEPDGPVFVARGRGRYVPQDSRPGHMSHRASMRTLVYREPVPDPLLVATIHQALQGARAAVQEKIEETLRRELAVFDEARGRSRNSGAAARMHEATGAISATKDLADLLVTLGVIPSYAKPKGMA